MTEGQFRQLMLERGFTDATTKEYGPNADEPMHTHEVSVMALVTSGELTLVLEDGSRTYGAGEWCQLDAGTLHTERTGPHGASIVLGRKVS